MKNNKIKISWMVLIFILIISFTFAEDAKVNYCCEKTVSGAWCQNAVKEQCDPNYLVSPTSCDSTSYCKPGCCFDTEEGLCLESTPQKVCSESNGTWLDNKQCSISQCALGCCILEDQGAFVTLTRCKQISGFYGLKTDFRSSITNELTCIATAQGDDKGACVTNNPSLMRKECTFTTRANCKGAATVSINDSLSINGTEKAFYKDVLCTAEELGTICSPTKKTTILEGKDEIYYLDSCGNIANIYDASRYDDESYWRNVYKKSESCGYGSSNAGSKNCGNCDYFLGSIGKKTNNIFGKATYGDYICIDLSCKEEGKKHGESWCVTDSPIGDGKDTVGSRYYKEICLFGEVITEPCADFRNEICLEDTFNSFSEAACRTNRWQDCVSQEEQSDCENIDQRDCMWIEDFYFSGNSGQIEKSNNDSKKGDLTPTGLCVPNYPPGFSFWGTTSSSSTSFSATTPTFNATSAVSNNSYGTGYVNPSSSAGSAGQCSLGNAKVIIKWEREKHPFVPGGSIGEVIGDIVGEERKGDWKCVENCQYVTQEKVGEGKNVDDYIDGEAWADEMNQICYKLGDCGGYINWQKKYTEDGYAAYFNDKRVAGAGGSEILEKAKTATTTNTNSGTSSTDSSTSSNNLAQAAGSLTGNLIKKILNKN